MNSTEIGTMNKKSQQRTSEDQSFSTQYSKHMAKRISYMGCFSSQKYVKLVFDT